MAQGQTDEGWFRAAVEATPSGVLIADAGGRIVLVNRAIERIFGYSRDELLGQSVELLVPERFRGAHRGERGRFHAASHSRAMGAGRDLIGLRKDGTEIPVEIGLTPMETASGRHIVSSIVDISERKRAETDRAMLSEQLRRAQKMEAVGQAAASIAHDFKNILTAIVAFNELAKQATPAGSVVRMDLEQIDLAAERGTALARQLMALGRHQESEPRTIDLNTVIAELAPMLRRLGGDTVQVITRESPTMGQIFVDPRQIEQLIMNLVINARDAMPNGGAVTIETDSVDLAVDPARSGALRSGGRHSVLVVRDTGVGIDADARVRIFEPYFTTKAPGRGTGLGLSIVHGIVQQSGGHVDVESEPGRGTTFRIYFPELEEQAVAVPSRARVDAATLGHPRILLVEPNASMRSFLDQSLRDAGFAVHQVATAVEGVAVLEAGLASLELVIANRTLPQAGWLTLGKRMTALASHTRLLLVCGHADASVEEFRGDPRFHYLRKPFTHLDLVAKVHDLLGTPSSVRRGVSLAS